MHLKTSVIVVGVDFSDLGDRAFQQAYELAAASASSEIHALFVMPTSAVNPLIASFMVAGTPITNAIAEATPLAGH